MKYQVTIAGRCFEIEVDHQRLVRVDGQPLYVDLEQVGGLPVYSLTLDQEGYVVFVEKGQGEYLVEVQGKLFRVDVQRQRIQSCAQPLRCSGDGLACQTIAAPMAGRLIVLSARAGDRVDSGQVVAVIESMKMQMELKAPKAGVVDAVCDPPPREVRRGDELMTLRVA